MFAWADTGIPDTFADAVASLPMIVLDTGHDCGNATDVPLHIPSTAAFPLPARSAKADR